VGAGSGSNLQIKRFSHHLSHRHAIGESMQLQIMGRQAISSLQSVHYPETRRQYHGEIIILFQIREFQIGA